MPAQTKEELNRFILIRYNEDKMDQTVEGYFETLADAKSFASKNFPDDAISVYELAGDCKDLA